MLTQKDLKHLAELARLDLKESEETKLLKDLQKILDYFEELKELDMTGVEPLAGGTFNKNVFRSDTGPQKPLDTRLGKEAFPEEKDGYLKIPPVFE